LRILCLVKHAMEVTRHHGTFQMNPWMWTNVYLRSGTEWA